MQDVVIVGAVRTAGGRMGGTIRDIGPEELSRIIIQEAIKRAGIEKESVDEVIWGQTKQTADPANIARVAALKANLPIEVPAFTVNRQCGSGLQAINSAAQMIQCGLADIIVAGGVESMSKAAFYLTKARYGYNAGNGILYDYNTESQPGSQPREMFGTFNMGETAENLATKYNISREEQDEFAFTSQKRAFAAITEGRFEEEITPVWVPNKKGDPICFEVDEHPRKVTMEKLAKLGPAFKKGGTVTAGNSSGRNDGAAGMILMSDKEAARRNIKPLAIIRGQGTGGVDPRIMGMGPVPACKKALKVAGLTLNDIGLIELNEAFAAQSLAVIKEMGIDRSITNVNGGAIALGHPLGCSGARILVTLVHEMYRRKVQYGLATLCCAGGQGITTVIEGV